MDKMIYKLANRIQPETGYWETDRSGAEGRNAESRNAEGRDAEGRNAEGLDAEGRNADYAGIGNPGEEEKLDERLKEDYRQSVLAAIRKDRRMTKRKRLRAAAACLAVLTAATLLFSNEVRAAIGRISYSLSMALGLDSDLATYKEVIHTSVRDGGYIVTLQEAVAAPEKLAVSYTVEREDGRAFSDGFDLRRIFGLADSFELEDSLYINGIQAGQFRKREQHFLDTQETVLGGKIAYDLAHTDLSGKNTYDLRLYSGKGNWNFRFQADGTDLYDDTKQMALGDCYCLPDGIQVTLDTLTVNELEQRITMHISEGRDISGYVITLLATDEQGRTAEFYAADVQASECVMYAEENHFLAADAKKVTVRMYAEELAAAGPRTEQGQVFQGTGEKILLTPFESVQQEAVWELTDLQ